MCCYILLCFAMFVVMFCYVFQIAGHNSAPIENMCFASDRRASACCEPKFLCRKHLKTNKNVYKTYRTYKNIKNLYKTYIKPIKIYENI